MVKKKIIVFGILAVILILILSFKPILQLSSEFLWDFVVTQFDKEEKDRQQKIENGEIVRGKDTILIWGNMYEIGHYSDSNHLEIYINGLSKNVLEKINKYKIVKKQLYIISDEGFAVVDKNNLCRVFITVPEKDFVNGYSIDEQGNKSYYTRYVDNKNIKYLSEFNEYSEEEQKIFDEMK